MPLTVDSSGGPSYDYSIAHVNRVNDKKNVEEIPKKEVNEAVVNKEFREASREEVEALFSHRQDTQLTKDILNTFAKKSDTPSSEFTFDDINSIHNLVEQDEPEPLRKDNEVKEYFTSVANWVF